MTVYHSHTPHGHEQKIMNDFPLSPFLITLSTDGLTVGISDYDRITRVLRTGGPWTLERLRGVLSALLVKNQEQEDIFNRRFDQFFSRRLPLSGKYSPAEVNLCLNELRAKYETGTAQAASQTRLDFKDRVVKAYYFIRRKIEAAAKPLLSLLRVLSEIFFVLILLITLAFTTYLLVKLIFGQSGSGSSIVIRQDNSNRGPTPTPTPPLPCPDCDVHPLSSLLIVLSFLFLGSFLGSFLVAVVLGELLVLLGYRPRPEPPKFDPKKPRLFSPQEVGGQTVLYLDDESLDGVARRFNYIFEAERRKCLDLNASINATSRGGGLPVLIYERVKRIRSVLVLEDAYSEPLVWNQSASQLTEGLARRGVTVRLGRFFGVPDKFWTSDVEGSTAEDLEGLAEDTLLLIFSDGKQLNSWRDAHALRSLARRPLVAWMDLRDPLFWDESAELVASFGLPLFPATASGVQLAVEMLLSGRPSSVAASGPTRPKIVAAPPNQLDVYTEWILGEALTWAQACSMMQPLPLGLADRLRQNFAPSLPPQRIETLFRLPCSTWDVSGLRFSLDVLSVLRSGFSSRLSVDEQDQILRYIIRQIESAEPSERHSLRHLAWEWARERVRLELDPDEALTHIDRLLLTPLSDHIKSEFSHLGLPGETSVGGGKHVPLRALPDTSEGKRILLRLAPQISASFRSRSKGRVSAGGRLSFEERLRRTQTAIVQRFRRNPALRLWARLLSGSFEMLIYFPYQKGERDSSGYRIHKKYQSQ